MPQARGRTKKTARVPAATEDPSSGEDTPQDDPTPSRQRKSQAPKTADKSAVTAALEEVQALSQPAPADSAPINKTAPTKSAPAPAKASALPQQDADGATERVREMEKNKREREAQEKQAAEIQRLAAENQKLKRKLNVAAGAESTNPKAPKTRKSNSERREKVVNAVFLIWIFSVIL